MERLTNSAPRRSQKREELPTWVPVAGAIFGGFTLLFIGLILILSVFGYRIPDDSRYVFSAFFSLGAGLSTGFLGADAIAKGKLPLPFAEKHAIEFGTGGAIAVVIIVFVLSIWASSGPSATRRVDNLPIQILKSDWVVRSCDWSFEGTTGTALRSAGPKSNGPQWWLQEPAGQVDCEILYGPELPAPYRVAVDLLITSGEGKGGLIFGDDGNYYRYFELHIDRGNSTASDLTLWTNHPFNGVRIAGVSASYMQWVSLSVEVYSRKIFFYVDGKLVYEESGAEIGHSRIGLRSAFSVVQFKHFSINYIG
jgi:hypothetical protein